MNDPLVTVALPTWSSAGILWLQLESLCRQEGAPPWELLVCEESGPEHCGAAYVARYGERLKAAGCVDWSYVDPGRRLPLSDKWRLLGQMAHRASRAFVLAASDNYSPPDRLRAAYGAVDAGYAWHDTGRGHFLDLPTGALGLYVNDTGGGAALFMALRTDAVRALPAVGRAGGVDHWLLHELPRGARSHRRAGPLGLHTDGQNHISTYRATLYNGRRRAPGEPRWKGPFRPPMQTLDECVPGDIADRLIAMQEVALRDDASSL